jgi:DNA-binding Xre family transcriptional regulator
MAKRWTIEEDYIVCKYCMENRWAFSSDIDIEIMGDLLQKAGFSSRSKIAIKKRARNYEDLIANVLTPYATNQEYYVLEMLYSQPQTYSWIDQYIAEVYRPGELIESLGIYLEDNVLNVSNYLPIENTEVKTSFYNVLDELLEKYYDKYKDDKKTRGAIKKQFKDSLTTTYGVSIDTFNSIRREKYGTVSRKILFKLCFALELNYDDAKRLLESIGLDFRRNEKEEVVIEAILKCNSSRRFIIYEINDTLERNGCKPLF